MQLHYALIYISPVLQNLWRIDHKAFLQLQCNDLTLPAGSLQRISRRTWAETIRRKRHFFLRWPPPPSVFVGNSPFPKAWEIWGRSYPAAPIPRAAGRTAIGWCDPETSQLHTLPDWFSIRGPGDRAPDSLELQAATCERRRSRKSETVTQAHLLLVRFWFLSCWVRQAGSSPTPLPLVIYPSFISFCSFEYIFCRFYLPTCWSECPEVSTHSFLQQKYR